MKKLPVFLTLCFITLSVMCQTGPDSHVPCHADFTWHETGNLTVQFTDLSTGNTGIRFWNFGDGSTSTLHNPEHTYPTQGLYTVILTMGDSSSSCYDSKPIVISVGGYNMHYLNISGFVTNQFTGYPIPGQAVTWGITGDTLGGPHTTYTNVSGYYSDSLLLPQNVTSGPYYVWTQDCQYIYWIGGSFNPGYHHINQNFTLTCEPNPPCQAKIGVAAAGILSVQFQDLSLGGVTTRAWNFGDGTTSTDQNPLHTFPTPGDYLVSLSISDSITGCSGTTTKPIYFVDSLLCNSRFSFAAGAAPRSISFTDLSSGAGGIRFWDFGDGENSNDANPMHTYHFPGLYMVTLSIGNQGTPCHQNSSRAVMVNDSILPCHAHFTYTINPATGFKTVQFTDLSTGTPSGWQWGFGDGNTSNLKNPVHTYATPGTFHVCLTISGNACNDTFCEDVVVPDTTSYHQLYGQVFAGNFPVPAGLAMIFSVDTTGNYNPWVQTFQIAANGVYYFTLVPDGDYYLLAMPANISGYLPGYYDHALTWTQAPVLSLGAAHNPYDIHLPQAGIWEPGVATLSGQIRVEGLKTIVADKINMLIMNSNGTPVGFRRVTPGGGFEFQGVAYGTYYLRAELPGVTSDLLSVTLSAQKPMAFIQMTFTGNRILGTDDLQFTLDAGMIYPNPVGDAASINITTKGSKQTHLELYAMDGRIVLREEVTLGDGKTKITLPVGSIPDGLYTLRIFTSDGINLIRKLLKSK